MEESNPLASNKKASMEAAVKSMEALKVALNSFDYAVFPDVEETKHKTKQKFYKAVKDFWEAEVALRKEHWNAYIVNGLAEKAVVVAALDPEVGMSTERRRELEEKLQDIDEKNLLWVGYWKDAEKRYVMEIAEAEEYPSE